MQSSKHTNDSSPRQSHLPWIDISIPLRNAMVHWPSAPQVKIERVKDAEQGASSTVSMISMGSYIGTHVDAPLHFIQRGISIDKMPLDATIGRSRVIEIQDTESIKPQELARHMIRRGERILFKTRSSSLGSQKDVFMKISCSFQTKQLVSLLTAV